jgi:hypothetical protein
VAAVLVSVAQRLRSIDGVSCEASVVAAHGVARVSIENVQRARRTLTTVDAGQVDADVSVK